MSSPDTLQGLSFEAGLYEVIIESQWLERARRLRRERPGTVEYRNAWDNYVIITLEKARQSNLHPSSIELNEAFDEGRARAALEDGSQLSGRLGFSPETWTAQIRMTFSRIVIPSGHDLPQDGLTLLALLDDGIATYREG